MYTNIKQRTVKNYQLQFGKAIPLKYFEPPKQLYWKAKSSCETVDPGYERKLSGGP
jgi:hypothetical protein